MGLLGASFMFTFPERRHYFVAERGGRVIAFLGVIPIYARRGWFFEDFLRDADAPNGTVELLIDAGMRAAAADGVPFVTLGFVPLSGDVAPTLRAARRLGRALYDFDGLRAFKAKFAPRAWDPIFLSYPKGGSSVLAVVDTLTAFARGGLLRFGLETLLRGPAIVMRTRRAALVWTALLRCRRARWFPSPWMQWLGRVRRRARGALLVLASVATAAGRYRRDVVTADAAVTSRGDRIRRRAAPARSDVAVVSIAILAPTVAAICYGTRAHHDPSQ
jgi:phosphatidylglycerol lysyltransferase